MGEPAGHFRPCLGKTACAEGGTHCRACGRSFPEIDRTRELVDELASLVLEMDYDNPEDFASYVAQRILKKVARERAPEGAAA
jgi:hypothetical protein